MPTFFMFKSLIILSLISTVAFAQDTDGTKAIAKVFKVLSGAEKAIPLAKDSLLQAGAWEALAYLDVSRQLQSTPADLQEAVPDYYRFKNGGVLFRLIDQEDSNQYGYEGKLSYRWEGDYLVIHSISGLQEKDRWQLLYVDKQYLALRMGDLRVFFTHAKAQEP